MVKDRLSDFQILCVKNGVMMTHDTDSDLQDGDNCDIPSTSENDEFLNEDEWAHVDQFLNKVSDITRKLEDLESLAIDLKRIHKEILQSPGTEPSLIQSLDDVVNNFTTLSKNANSILNSIIRDADGLTDLNEAQLRIKNNQIFTLKKRISAVLTEFNAEQVSYKEKCKEKMRTYLKCVDRDMTEDEIDEAIESGKLYSTKSLMLGDRDQQLIWLQGIEDRHQDIIKLEKNIIELRELFFDVSMLVDNQGDILNNIEANVAAAADIVERARRNVHQAKEMKKYNVKLRVAICLGTTILILLLLALGGSAFCFYFRFVCH